MANSASNPAARRRAVTMRLLGYAVFVAAFFLPAVREVATPGAGLPEAHVGYFCAWITLINSFNREVWHSKEALAILSGWINPLMLLYIAFLFSRHLRPARLVVGTLVALFFVATWAYFVLAPLVPLVGHFLWFAGAALVLCGDFLPGGASVGGIAPRQSSRT